jgi:hypothetical protein
VPPLGVVNEKKKERIRIKQRRKQMMTNKVIQFLKREIVEQQFLLYFGIRGWA